MELKLINTSFNDSQYQFDKYKDCYIEILFNGKKMGKISFLMFHCNKEDNFIR